jgi:hypothetical protein
LGLSHKRAGYGFIVDEISEATIDFDALANRKARRTIFDKLD